MENIDFTMGFKISGFPLASSLHAFKSDTLAEAYSDLEKQGMLNPVGIAALTDIPYVKDQLIKDIWPMRKARRIKRNGKGYYYLSKLSRSERKNYLKSLAAENRNLIPTRVWMQCTFSDMDDFICSSFGWSETKQGLEYWSKISDRARWNTEPKKLSGNDIYDILLEIHDKLKS